MKVGTRVWMMSESSRSASEKERMQGIVEGVYIVRSFGPLGLELEGPVEGQ